MIGARSLAAALCVAGCGGAPAGSVLDRPPALIYRDARGTLLEELPIGSN